MTKTRLLLAFCSLVTVAACGGGGDDDGGGVDSRPRVDTVAAADSAPPAEGLGQTCSPSAACNEAAPQCIAVDGETAVDGFCTLPCGDNSSGTIMPDHTICQAAYSGTGGVPSCILADNVEAPTAFFCGFLCGSGTTPADGGACPSGLTCGLNLDPADAGAEGCSD